MNKDEFIEVINKIISILSDSVESLGNIIKLNRVNDVKIGANDGYAMEINNTKYDSILIINEKISYEQEELIKSRLNDEYSQSDIYFKFFRSEKDTLLDRESLIIFISNLSEDAD